MRKVKSVNSTAVTFWKRFHRNKMAVFGGVIVLIIMSVGLLAPIIAPYDPSEFVSERFSPPSLDHLFGTDKFGRDVLSRIIWGTRVSLLVGFGATFIATIIGVIIGCIAGYFRGVIEIITMRATDTILAIPAILLYILLFAIFRSQSVYLLFIILGFTRWPSIARIVRSSFLSLTEEDYIKAAKSLGASDLRIVFRHLLPNAMAPIIVTATMNIAGVILIATSLAFLGFGDPTIVSWGSIITEGRDVFRSAWWITSFSGSILFLTSFGFNLLGDGLRDSLDPRLRGTIKQ